MIFRWKLTSNRNIVNFWKFHYIFAILYNKSCVSNFNLRSFLFNRSYIFSSNNVGRQQETPIPRKNPCFLVSWFFHISCRSFNMLHISMILTLFHLSYKWVRDSLIFFAETVLVLLINLLIWFYWNRTNWFIRAVYFIVKHDRSLFKMN